MPPLLTLRLSLLFILELSSLPYLVTFHPYFLSPMLTINCIVIATCAIYFNLHLFRVIKTVKIRVNLVKVDFSLFPLIKFSFLLQYSTKNYTPIINLIFHNRKY